MFLKHILFLWLKIPLRYKHGSKWSLQVWWKFRCEIEHHCLLFTFLAYYTMNAFTWPKANPGTAWSWFITVLLIIAVTLVVADIALIAVRHMCWCLVAPLGAPKCRLRGRLALGFIETVDIVLQLCWQPRARLESARGRQPSDWWWCTP